MIAALLDMGSGNLLSIQRGLERSGLKVEKVTSARELRNMSCIILPGVGHFSFVCKQLEPLRGAILENVEAGVSVLGICLGMQLLFQGSQEGCGKGLGILEGNAVRFDDSQKVPHIGWNTVDIQKSTGNLEGLPSKSQFYFVHSYYIPRRDRPEEIGVTEYGKTFVSVVQRRNILGTQFHPERSGAMGRTFLEEYVRSLRR